MRALSPSFSAKSNSWVLSWMWSGLPDPGMTAAPFCRFRRRIAWAEDFPCACGMAEITASPSSSAVWPLPPSGYRPRAAMPGSRNGMTS